MKNQRGFSLMVAMVMIVLVSGMTIAYMQRSSLGARATASLRDADLAQSLGEAALGRVIGRFASADATLADLDSNGAADRDDAATVDYALGSYPLNYAFYAQSAGDVPVVQRVATGEGSGTAAKSLTSKVIANSVTTMRVSDLFISTQVRPFLFIQNSGGGISASSNTWDSESSNRKAAVWLEMEINPSNAAAVDVYCAVAAQYDRARSYLRQYVGTYQ
jgi:Tfp pilus assembly protein PilX